MRLLRRWKALVSCGTIVHCKEVVHLFLDQWLPGLLPLLDRLVNGLLVLLKLLSLFATELREYVEDLNFRCLAAQS